MTGITTNRVDRPRNPGYVLTKSERPPPREPLAQKPGDPFIMGICSNGISCSFELFSVQMFLTSYDGDHFTAIPRLGIGGH